MKKFLTVMSVLAASVLPSGLYAQDSATYDFELNAQVLGKAEWYGCRRSEGNNNLNNYYIVFGDKALGENDTPVAGSTVYAFDLFSAAPTDESNPQPPVGVYTLATEIGSDVLYDDSHVYQLDGNGNYEVDRTFTAGTLTVSSSEKDGNTYYKYEAFLTDNAGATHHVTYESRFITYDDLSQGSRDLEKNIDFTATYASAKYRALAGDNDENMHIFLYLSDVTRNDENEETYEKLPARNMNIELYMPKGNSLANGTYNVAEGAEDKEEAFTVQTGEIVSVSGVEYPVGTYADYIYGNRNLAWGCIKSGTITVSGDDRNKSIVGDLLTDFGFSVKFRYEGAVPVTNIPQTGFTEPVTELDLEGASATFECVGDLDRLNNCRNWQIILLPAEGKDHGFLTDLCSRGKTFFDGVVSETYTASPSRIPWKGEYTKGRLNDKGQLSGTWAMTAFNEEGNPTVNAPATSGDMIITRHEDGETYTIDFDLSDGIGHSFKGKWTGKPELINSCGDEEDPSGVDGVFASDKEVIGIYSLDGAKSDAKEKGIYIVKYSDGSFAKKIVK